MGGFEGTLNHVVVLVGGVTVLILVLENPDLIPRAVSYVLNIFTGAVSLAHPPKGQ